MSERVALFVGTNKGGGAFSPQIRSEKNGM